MPSTRVNMQVVLTLNVDIPDNWSPDCAVGQVHKQATQSAREHVDKVVAQLKGAGIPGVSLARVDILPGIDVRLEP